MHIVTNSEILFYFLKEEKKKASDKQTTFHQNLGSYC